MYSVLKGSLLLHSRPQISLCCEGAKQRSGFSELFGLLSNTPVLSTGYGIEHAQCVPPSEFSEPSFITESYQTLHPISSEELLSLKYENDYPSVILRDPVQTDSLQTDYFTIKQEVVTPDNMCMGRASRGKVGCLPGFAWVLAIFYLYQPKCCFLFCRR